MTRQIQALTVSQWLPTWENVDFDPDCFRRKPPEQFLVFSIEALALRRLIGIQRRDSASGLPRTQDLGIQRAHDKERSDEIAEYVQRGFPWSKLSKRRRDSGEFDDLTKPGWLPTAVVVNILLPSDDRGGRTVDEHDLVSVDFRGTSALVELPDIDDDSWVPTGIPPIEVIDGQHRLWAFDKSMSGYEVPVVAFYGLDRSWQAYLFYTINISPKRINPSLAFDLYPLLRTEDWLERFAGHSVYRESRAQELTESMWSNPQSPWYQRINMLGERGIKGVTQNAWVRALNATIVKSWEGPGIKIGGLFGAPTGEHELVLPWNRAQQAAFIIYAWRALAESIMSLEPIWTHRLDDDESLFYTVSGLESNNSMLNSEMGVRAFLYAVNDLCFVRATDLNLANWIEDDNAAATSEDSVFGALDGLKEHPVSAFLDHLTEVLAQYDWRSSKAPHLGPSERQLKARFRGGTGYRELRQEVLRHIALSQDELGSAAREVIARLGYDQ